MKRKVLKIICILYMLMLLTVQIVSAEVYTASRMDGSEDSVFVAGNPDFYPIEYYNRETKQYEGVMPQILRTISERTGMDFTYIQEDASQTELANNLQAELVSAYVTDSGEAFAKDTVTVFSYTAHGKTVHVGFAFTEIADRALVEAVKSEAAKITEDERNGYFVTGNLSNPQSSMALRVTTIVCWLLFAVLIVLVWVWLANTKKQMKINAMTDGETGLGNLSYFTYHFENSISDLSRSLYYVVYIMMDGHYLQMYHGDAAFSDIVKYTAYVLDSYAKHHEFAARITENGFAVAFQSTNLEEAEHKVEEIIRKLNLYVETEEKHAKPIFHAVWYNLIPADRSSEMILFNLRRNCSKLLGTDTQTVFCDVNGMNHAIEEKNLMESIITGLKGQEFKLYLQFVVENKTGKIVSAEALSRWENPDKGILMPGKYIEAMEMTGIISRLDFYMFEMVCRQLHKWRETEFGSISISCNFTRITLSEEKFIENLRDISDKYVFDKSKLIIEITEDAIEKNLDTAMHNVLECKRMGFVIALDDLGSGYTSLSNLCDYPIDIVKIDRDILLKTDTKNGSDLFMGMIALAHSLNLRVVCEGVETETQNALVHASDCDYIQGWYYSKVYPARESEAIARKYLKG